MYELKIHPQSRIKIVYNLDEFLLHSWAFTELEKLYSWTTQFITLKLAPLKGN